MDCLTDIEQIYLIFPFNPNKLVSFNDHITRQEESDITSQPGRYSLYARFRIEPPQ